MTSFRRSNFRLFPPKPVKSRIYLMTCVFAYATSFLQTDKHENIYP